VVRAMAEPEVLQIANDVWIVALIFNTQVCEKFFFFSFFLCRSTL